MTPDPVLTTGSAYDPPVEDAEVVEHAGSDLAVREDAGVTLFRTDDPVEVIEKATRTANALVGAIQAHDAGKPAQKKLISNISGRDFPKVECWMLLGSMLGVFPVLDGEAEYVEIDGTSGWKATVNAVTRSGEVVGRATAFCMRSESTWKNRDLYAMASMAQTRATSKALAMPLRFVMILAGYEGTPAEEMTAATAAAPQTRSAPRTPPATPPPSEPTPATGRKITAPQVKKVGVLRSKLAESGLVTEAQYRKVLKSEYGVESTKDLTAADASNLIDRLEAKAAQIP